MTYKDGHVYVGTFKDDKMEDQGIHKWKNGNLYEGQYKDNKIMLQSETAKKKNQTPTLLLRSNKINDENRPLKYEKDKFLKDGKEVTAVLCNSAEEALRAIDGFIKTNSSSKEKKQCRIVFDQHGGEGGVNDIKIDKCNAKAMLTKLAEAGFKDITISDLACHGGTAHHFLKVEQDVAKQKEVNIKVRYAKEGRTCIDGLKWNNNESRLTAVTIDKDGKALPREVKVFGPKSNVTNPSTTQLDSSSSKDQSKQSSLAN